jgi:hypothetical protein
MMKTQTIPETSEISIFGRIIDRGALSVASAKYLLSLDFSNEDKTRMEGLADRNQEDNLAAREKEELVGFSRAACLLGILHSKARKALKSKKRAAVS